MSARKSNAGLSVLTLVPMLCAAGAGAASAQPTMPTGGTTNTLSLVGTLDSVSAEPGTFSVKAADGTTQLFRFAGKLFVHDGKPEQDDALSGVHRGMPVVIHYRADGKTLSAEEIDLLGGDGLKTTEGRVVSIDRNRQEIKILLPDDKTETLKLTERASQSIGRDLDKAANPTVVVYYTDEAGGKVVHYFRKK